MKKLTLIFFTISTFYYSSQDNGFSVFLPTEDIDIINTLSQNIENLENYNYSNIINKYNVKDFIVCLIFQDNDKIKVLSKITINNNEKIQNNIYNNINLDNISSVMFVEDGDTIDDFLDFVHIDKNKLINSKNKTF